MKKIIAILMSIILTLGFAACGKEEKSEESKSSKSKVTVTYAEKELSEEAVLEEEASTEATTEGVTEEVVSEETTTKKTETTTKKPSVQNPTSEFFNEANCAIDVNSVSIKPRYVYWDNGCLVAECFVINGYDTPASNITVDSLSFENKSVKIASGYFGELSGLVVGPYSYAVWTFRFMPDDVENYGANLETLNCKYDCSYSH